MSTTLRRWSLVIVLICMTVNLPVMSAEAHECPHDGDVNGDGNLTPGDALLAFQHFLGTANPPLDTCQQDRANVQDPHTSGITPADALCIFQKFLGLPSCLDNQPSDFILDVSQLDDPRYQLR